MDDRDRLLNDYLDSLTNSVCKIIIENLQSKKISPESEAYTQTKIENFVYNENGPNYSRSSHWTAYRENWVRAGFFIGDIVFKTDAYLTIETFLQENYSNQNAKHIFPSIHIPVV